MKNEIQIIVKPEVWITLIQPLITFPTPNSAPIAICIHPEVRGWNQTVWVSWTQKNPLTSLIWAYECQEPPPNSANPNHATVSPFRGHQCASLMVLQNPRKLWLHGISFSLAEEWTRSWRVRFTMWRKVFLVLVIFCCSLIKTTWKMPLRCHTIIYSIVARWLGCRREYSLSQTEKDSQMAIVLTRQSFSQGRNTLSHDIRNLVFFPRWDTSLEIALIQDWQEG